MKTTFIPKYKCTCGYEMDATSGAGHDVAPTEGDMSICFQCGKIWIFNADLTQREATDADIAEIKADKEAWEELQRARNFVLSKHWS